MEQKKLLLDVNEKPTKGKWIILALQHVFAMFGATILVPIMVNTSAGETVLTIPVALVTSGIGTLIYILCTKIHFIGKNWINKLLPPIVIGPMIMIIGLSLAPSAISQIGLGTGEQFDVRTVFVALITFLVTAIIMVRGKRWVINYDT